MALDEAKERRRVRQAARAYDQEVEQWQREYVAKMQAERKAIERAIDLLNGGAFTDEEKARRDAAAAADAQASREANLAAIAEKSRSEEERRVVACAFLYYAPLSTVLLSSHVYYTSHVYFTARLLTTINRHVFLTEC